jgi:hypothetical protein
LTGGQVNTKEERIVAMLFEMNIFGFGLIVVLFGGGVWLLIRLMGRTDRNDGSTHGGGVEGRTHGVDDGANL